MASSFKQLRDFIQQQMRMSHIYQPVMIKELLKRRGKASLRNIAAAFLARDASQGYSTRAGSRGLSYPLICDEGV
jgi:ATP adenylyltransferase